MIDILQILFALLLLLLDYLSLINLHLHRAFLTQTEVLNLSLLLVLLVWPLHLEILKVVLVGLIGGLHKPLNELNPVRFVVLLDSDTGNLDLELPHRLACLLNLL